ncbi:MAG: Acylphosphatase [Myxococcota bacterium]|nr:Acylphosphatase [Myxococcota bacterium]
MMSAERSIHVMVQGRVQGVSFRAFVRETARQSGLTGWVRNRHDGRVEARVQGSARAIEEFLRECEKGPPAARVDEIQVSEAPAGEFSSFEIAPTV